MCVARTHGHLAARRALVIGASPRGASRRRPTATRGALLFFLMMSLGKMHTFYKYSLDAFVMVATRAINSVTLRKPKDAVGNRWGSARAKPRF